MAQTSEMIESVVYTDTELRIDEEQGIIRGVKILGRNSRNGYTYSGSALKEAAKLYSNVPVYLNHRDEHSPRVRATSEHWGRIINPRVHEDGVYGDLEYLREHHETAAILERARRMPNSFGLSHDAFGSLEGDVVTTIQECESVDVVTRPATNQGLFEQHDPSRSHSMPTTPKKKTVAESLAGKKGADAKHLRKLLEMDDYEAMGEEPVVVDDPATPEDEMQASIDALVMAVLHDAALDAAGKVAKIRQILNVGDKLSEPAEEPSGEGGEGGEDEPLPESVQLVNRLKQLEKRETARDLLEEYGYTFQDLEVAQRKALLKQDDEDTMRTLIEAFPITRGKSNGGPKPAARPLRESSADDDETYEDLLAQTNIGRRRK